MFNWCSRQDTTEIKRLEQRLAIVERRLNHYEKLFIGMKKLSRIEAHTDFTPIIPLLKPSKKEKK